MTHVLVLDELQQSMTAASLAAEGYAVVGVTSDPAQWVDGDIERLMSVDVLIVSPLWMVAPGHSQRLACIMESFPDWEYRLYVGSQVFLALALESGAVQTETEE